MPLIEELPVNSTVRASHGWAYVPDTGPIAAVQPGTRDRKRTTTNPRGSSASAKQQKAIQQRLDSLDKENYKDGVNVPIPPRPAGRENKTNKKTSTNVKRILMYQRTFAHYLADEETNAAIAAAIVAAGPTTSNTSKSAMAPPPPASTPSQRTETTKAGRRKSGLRAVEASPTASTTTTPRPRGRPPKRSTARSSTDAPSTKVENEEDQTEDTEMTDASQAQAEETTESSTPQKPPDSTTQPANSIMAPAYDASYDKDPMLISRDVPKMPSERIMHLLLSEPPLSYMAARAKPVSEDEDRQGGSLPLPKRHFCSLCGYWGRVKCRKCEDWTCGLMECWKGHESVCVMNAY